VAAGGDKYRAPKYRLNATEKEVARLRQQLSQAQGKVQDRDVEMENNLVDSRPACHLWANDGKCRLGDTRRYGGHPAEVKVATETAVHSFSS
jgi:hypothetical protein